MIMNFHDNDERL